MVRCPDCETSNSTDSKFCKFCGAALPEEELIDAQIKLNELLSEGYRIFNEGRTEEARLIAESALESAPNTAQALTLKAMCCEREGELADALELYEKVVELNPDSTLDKIKVTHLRNQLNAKQIEAPEPNRKLALMVAAAAVILVVCVGGLIAALTSDKASATEKSPLVASNEPDNKAFDKTGSVPQQENPAPMPDKTQVQPQPGIQEQPGVRTSPRPWNGDPFPSPEGNQNPFGPITLEGPKVPGIGDAKPNTNPTGPTATTQPNPRETDRDPQPEPEKQPEEKKPVIEVSIKHGSTNYGGSDDSNNSQELTVLMAAAYQQFTIGRYQNAASNYEKALKVGADPASTNQKLGQCYSNLGRKSEAINSYVRAIDAYKSGLSRNNSPSLRAGLTACNNALRVLRGE